MRVIQNNPTIEPSGKLTLDELDLLHRAERFYDHLWLRDGYGVIKLAGEQEQPGPVCTRCGWTFDIDGEWPALFSPCPKAHWPYDGTYLAGESGAAFLSS